MKSKLNDELKDVLNLVINYPFLSPKKGSILVALFRFWLRFRFRFRFRCAIKSRLKSG